MFRKEIDEFIKEHPFSALEVLISTKEGKEAIKSYYEYNKLFGVY